MIIKRARGHRLYTSNGKKIIDLSMDWGRGVLGHRPNGLSLVIKNVIERGLYAGYDNIYKERLINYLKKQFPDYGFITILEYEDKATGYFQCNVVDPLFTEVKKSDTLAYWRPFLKTPESDNLIILYPFPGLNSTTILLSREKPTIESDNISPILLSGILRSMYDYDMELKTFDKSEYSSYKNIRDSRLLPPYIVFDRGDEDYNLLVAKVLEHGILLNEKKKFGVLSRDFSKGEVDKILKLLEQKYD